MSVQFSRFLLPLSFAVVVAVGCQKASEPAQQPAGEDAAAPAEVDPHDVPLTDREQESIRNSLANYGEALTQIKSYRDAIREAVAAGNPPEAHRPLDELDIVLEHLPTVARESDIPKSEWETVNTSAQRLRELFNQVHARIDAGEEPDFSGVADQIESEISKLESSQTAG